MKAKRTYIPKSHFLDALPRLSGNEVNGLGEAEYRKTSPFFWHPPNRQQFGELQNVVTEYHRRSPEIREVFDPDAGRGIEPIPQAEGRVEKSAAAWAAAVKEYALAHEGDLVGITPMRPEYVYEGYSIDEPWVIIIGVTMEYDSLRQAPPSFENPEAGVEVGRQYNRAARACRQVRNLILSQGYFAKAYQGPYASALSMMPAAIAAGFGELGKHGSLINREHGSMFRLAAVTTDLPLVADVQDEFCADEFCSQCQVCVQACPPDAISGSKQMVRGVEKWYVDFDKCIPHFGEALGCAVCIARCPWSKPGTAPRLAKKMLRRRARRQAAD
ncbi:MAG: 4Fe-4S dicluster domain-containing protein [Gammaproteobacteria bacterium]|nr:4Fe-4S dicluster domain-containing protein [Gammaproteobacteria bacterium]